MLDGLRLSTKQTYCSAQRNFIRFCNTFNLVPVPSSEQTVLWYMAYTQSRPGFKPIKASSLKVHLSAIRSLHVLSGCAVPPTTTPRVSLILKAIFNNGPGPVQKLPITYSMLHHLCTGLGQSHHTLVWHAALTLGFFGGLRGAEYTLVPSPSGPLCPPLLVSHVSFGIIHGLDFMSVFIPRSKTKPHGFLISIGCSGTPTCAVCSMHAYLRHRAGLSPILPNSYLFVLPDGAPLLKSILNQKIKCLVSSIGMDPSQFSSHSMRAGVATTAAIAGFNEVQVKSIGGWSSQAYTLYIRDTQMEQITYAKKLTY